MKSFEELNLSEPINKAISELGFTTPSPIQAEALPILMSGPTDFIGLAATGTGKTAAFGIPLLEQIDTSRKTIQGLVMCPTRELALQVSQQLNLLGKYKGIKNVPVYGGTGYSEQIAGFRQGVQIVVGTPGRLIDHIEKGYLKLNDIRVVILDEADEMISMGFKEDLETILEAIPPAGSKTWLFSATMSKEVRKVADTYLREPKQVAVNRTEMLSATVEQVFYPTREGDKPEVLCKIIEAASDDFYGLIFCQTKSLTTDLTHYLTSRGYKVDCLHGDRDQKERERTMQAFRDKKVRMLVCTDVAARGLDVKDVTHVINYSIPRELDTYVHRIGRTARSGKSGIAISLVTPSHRMLVTRIEKMTKSKMTEARVPSRKEIGLLKINKTLGKFMEQTNHTRATQLLTDEWKTAIELMSPDEIVGRFLAMTAPEVFELSKEKERPLSQQNSGLQDSRGGDDSRGPRKAYGSNRGQSYQDKPFRGGGGGGRREDYGDRPQRGGGSVSRGGRPGDRGDRPYGDRPQRRDFNGAGPSMERSSRPSYRDDGPSRPSRRDEGPSFERPSRPVVAATPYERPSREVTESSFKKTESYERPSREASSPSFERPAREVSVPSFERSERSEKSASYERPTRTEKPVVAERSEKRSERPVREQYDANERSVRREAEERRLAKKAREDQERVKPTPGNFEPREKKKTPKVFGSKYIPTKPTAKSEDVGDQPPRRNKRPVNEKRKND